MRLRAKRSFCIMRGLRIQQVRAAAMEREENAAKTATAATPMSATAKESASLATNPATPARTPASAAHRTCAVVGSTPHALRVMKKATIAQLTTSAAPGRLASPTESAQPVRTVVHAATPTPIAAAGPAISKIRDFLPTVISLPLLYFFPVVTA